MISDLNSKELHENTSQVLDRVRRGESFRVVRHGKPDAFLVPPSKAVDPDWPEIMAEVWAAQKEDAPARPNPVLRERKRRNYAAHLR